MKLVYYNHKPNFGDALSPLLCDALFPPSFLDDNEQELLLGVGSILWDYLPTRPIKHVLGSGYGGYTAPPDVHDGRWNIVFVRGPRTTSLLRLPAKKAICDAATLLRLTELPGPAPDVGVAFMPHCASYDRGYWSQACSMAGITLIDPRHDPAQAISIIRGAKLVVAEAMHGAIVADALRIPWVAAKPLHHINRNKWYDWAESLGIKLRWARLFPTSLMETYHACLPSAEPWRAEKTRERPVYAPLNRLLTNLAASQLARVAKREPQLSDEARLREAVERAATATDLFIRSKTTAGLRTNAALVPGVG